jgi:hypothetical protein
MTATFTKAAVVDRNIYTLTFYTTLKSRPHKAIKRFLIPVSFFFFFFLSFCWFCWILFLSFSVNPPFPLLRDWNWKSTWGRSKNLLFEETTQGNYYPKKGREGGIFFGTWNWGQHHANLDNLFSTFNSIDFKCYRVLFIFGRQRH